MRDQKTETKDDDEQSGTVTHDRRSVFSAGLGRSGGLPGWILLRWNGCNVSVGDRVCGLICDGFGGRWVLIGIDLRNLIGRFYGRTFLNCGSSQIFEEAVAEPNSKAQENCVGSDFNPLSHFCGLANLS